MSRRYEFRVAGWLSNHTRGAFPDMVVVEAPPETIIYGDVLDEAHLHGVLVLIQDLGLRMVSLHEVPDRRQEELAAEASRRNRPKSRA